MNKEKIAIIGSGPGGYVAAIRASQLGAEVTVIEEEAIGGTCLNHGCIPTKTLLTSAELFNSFKEAEEFGVCTGEIKADFAKIMERKSRVVDNLRGGIQMIFKKRGIQLIHGKGTLISPQRIQVVSSMSVKEMDASKILITTGSKPTLLPSLKLQQPSILSTKEALDLKKLPNSILIIGGGAIGLEFACFFNALGTRVTLVEMMDQLLPNEDKRISRQIAQILKKRGVNILLKTSVKDIVSQSNEGITCLLENGDKVSAEKLTLSIGRKPNSQGIGLEHIGVHIDKRGNILVNKKMETNVTGIYAAGDVIGGMLLAHVASAESIIAVENALGIESQIDYSTIPRCVYTFPEIASVGQTADEALASKREVKTGWFPFSASGKACVIGQAYGSVYLLVEKGTEKIIGGQIIGPHATELIHEIALAIKLGITAEDLSSTIHAHPTLSESIAEAAHSVNKKAIHIL
ncbi:MAG: dihydrolipoyl dehydrogenase [Thermodesulfobacteriota bacterium]|nr:dihydrolipoyl dehydrogenase [Thermodesulfobacteriota bacterium]